MLHFVSGSNGTGKTLISLKWVRERQLKENRPVCYNGRFDIIEDGELKSWKKIDFRQWQDEPDGTIFFVDECHNDLPNRASGAVVPEYVKMLAEHRKRGFDFYLISQHPGNVDSFVRRLVGAPGWHRHLKRVAGGSSLVSCIQWDAINPNCERNGSGATGEVSMVPFPKEVFAWYRSASLHTAKLRIPKAVYVLVVAVVVVVGAVTYGLSSLRAIGGNTDGAKAAAKAPGGEAFPMPGGGGGGGAPKVMTVLEYLDSRKARLPDFPHTAPAYDQVSQPVEAPYPAACVQMAGVCKCYTQQATVLPTTVDVCQQIVRNGYFVDWKRAEPAQARQAAALPPLQQAAPQAPPVVVQIAQSGHGQQQASSDWAQGLAARNAQVRSSLER